MAPPVLAVRETLWGMEWSAHAVPRAYTLELQSFFPAADLGTYLIVPTCQRAVVDLVPVGEAQDQEKDACLERFVGWAKEVCTRLLAAGHACDYVDPCSGMLMLNRDCQHVYGEVDALTTLLQYKTTNTGCCKVVHHPSWGTAVYPATLFTSAPPEALQRAVQQAERAIKADVGQ